MQQQVAIAGAVGPDIGVCVGQPCRHFGMIALFDELENF